MKNGTKRPSWVPENLYPLESHYAEVGDASIHYIDEGASPRDTV